MNTGKHRNTVGLKPFKKGDDPRRWKHGQKSKETVKVSRDIQQWLSLVGEEIQEAGKTYSEVLARKLWERAIKGEIPVSDIILGVALAGLVGEKIWMAVVKAKALKANGKNGDGKSKQITANCIVDKVLEEQALKDHYDKTTTISASVEKLCEGVNSQQKSSVQIVTILGEIAENTRGLAGRRG